MSVFLSIVLVLLFLTASVGVAIYFRSRKLLREQKNFERGLKMVPLLIDLPPRSEDTEKSNRDQRDVVEEKAFKKLRKS